MNDELAYLLIKLKEKYKTDAMLCKVAGINVSTLWRFRTGEVKQLRAKTVKKLFNALNAVN